MEVIVIVSCLLLGYWIVGAFLNRKSPPSTKSGTEDFSRSSAARDEQANARTPSEVNGIAATWHRILGVSPQASQQEIAAAYRKLIAQYHPDKVAQMGAEIREVAEAKTKQINAAYDYATKPRT